MAIYYKLHKNTNAMHLSTGAISPDLSKYYWSIDDSRRKRKNFLPVLGKRCAASDQGDRHIDGESINLQTIPKKGEKKREIQ